MLNHYHTNFVSDTLVLDSYNTWFIIN